MESPLLGLPREIRDSETSLPSFSMTIAHLTNASAPVVISEIVIVDDQPFRIRPTAKMGIAPKSSNGLALTCKQINAEYSHLLRKAAFTPGTRTVAPVYNFDFSEMISFVRTLKPHEVQAANRNKNLAANLFISTFTNVEAQRLKEWLQVAENVGIELQYVVHDMKSCKAMESVVGQTREGRKIVKALRSRSVDAWSWEGYQAGLKARGR